jgi:hypothetical protein
MPAHRPIRVRDRRARRLLAALLAAATGAFASAPVAAAAPADECARPLSSNDLDALDKVADGRLYLSEVDAAALDCLVQRLARTKDAKTRGAFRGFIQNDVWEEVRARLAALERDPSTPPDLRRRVADLRATDYSDAALFVGGLAHGKLERERIVTTSGGAVDRYAVETRSIRLGASGDGVFQPGAWKIQPALSAFGDALWSAAGPAAGGTRSYLGAGGDGALSVLRRDERVNLSAYGFLNAYRDPPPQRSFGAHGAGGSGKLREIGGSALGIDASADWYADDRAPLGDDYFDPSYEELTLHGEGSYMWPAAGLLATYDHVLYDDRATVYRSRYVADSGALVLHVPFAGESYLRLALGGGTWGEAYRQLGGDPSDSSGGELHGKLSGELRVARPLRLDLSLTARANAAHGSFEGWYPSGVAQLGATFEAADLRLRAVVTVSGERRDLNRFQENGYLAATADAAYAPTDAFNVTASGGWQRVRQLGADAYDDLYWRWSAAVGYRLSRKLAVWLWTEAQLTGESYAAAGLAQELSSAMLLERLSFRY